MKTFSRPKVLSRAVALLCIDLALLVATLVWFDFLGIVDLRSALSPVYSLFGAQGRSQGLPADLPELLLEERYGKRLEEISLWREELAASEGETLARMIEVDRARKDLEDREKTLSEREFSFNETLKEVENRKANVERIALNLVGMRPEQAVKILLEMDDQLVIDVLRAVESAAAAEGRASIVPFWLASMPPDRSAAIQRKMTVSPAVP